MEAMFRFLLLLPLCAACLDASCPCGADPSSPFAVHDQSFPGTHFVEGECLCRCGEHDTQALPRDRDCADYEALCIDREGDTARLRCE